MNATRLYVSAAQLVLTANTDSATAGGSATAVSSSITDLNRLLPLLRQLLSCAVCCRLLSDPYGPRDLRCAHNVCRLCIRGRKALRPVCIACRDAQDFRTYDENRQMRLLLLCYKSLCEHLMASPIFTQLSKQRQAPMQTVSTSSSSCILLPQMSAQEFVLEGASFDDVLSSFSVDLPRSISALPVLGTPLVTGITTSNLVKTATPPVVCVTASHITPTLPPPPPPPPLPALPLTNQAIGAPSTHTQVQTQQLTLKHLRSIVDLTGAAQLPAALTSTTTTTSGIVNNTPASFSAVSTPNISYINTSATQSSGFVLPATIVSQSTTTAGSIHMTSAPLTIASAKLQSLNRQLVQARAAAAAAAAAAASASNSAAVSSSSTAVADVQHNTPPLTFKVSLAPSASTSSTPTAIYSSYTSSAAPATTTATVTSQQIRNPPPIKTVSNGSAMYSVLYTGIGNKITIKRKTDGDDDAVQRKNAGISAPPTAVYRQMSAKLPNAKRRGCRCGNATPTPGKLTCCGQRCPCYVDSKSCIGCKCRGCRNPHRPDGGKVRPVIPELACYEIQMADESSSLSPNELLTTSSTTSQHMATAATPSPIATTFAESMVTTPSPEEFVVPLQTNNSNNNNSFTSPQLSLTPTSSSSNTAATATLIPFRNLQQIAAAHTQQQQQQQQQQTQQSQMQQQQQQTSNTLQLENLQRESVLIQNAEGKYQVVNVFTTGPHNQNTNQLSGLQRLHTISQLQAATSNSCGNSNNASNLSNTFQLLPTTTATIAASSTASTATTPTITQILMQQQHHLQQQQQQQQQHQQQTSTASHMQRLASSTSISSSSTCTTTIPLQLQQQLKHNNIITVHPITTSSHHHHHHQHQHQHVSVTASSQTTPPLQTMPLISTSMTPSTITLSPIIVSSSGNGGGSIVAPTLSSFAVPPPDMFSDSSDEFISLSNSAAAAAANVISVSSASSSNSHIVQMPQVSPLSLNGSGSASGEGTSADAVGTTHFAPAMIEVIESNDL